MQEPESIVRAFIDDYYRWNNRSYDRFEKDSSPETAASVEAEYEGLLRCFCRPGFQGKAVAFGLPSTHDPSRETIVECAIGDSRATIKTRNTDVDGFVADYEFLLVFDHGRWFLEAVDYLDEEGRYAGL